VPDKYDFNHLGAAHQCIWCDWPGYGVTVSERDRERHQAKHVRDRQREVEAKRLASLAKARKSKKQIDRENEAAYGS
jgi:hypothetical protein